MEYCISIGSNWDRASNLELAHRRLAELFPDVRFSAEEETAPIAMQRTALFTNQVALFHSSLSPDEVVKCLKRLEQAAGRCEAEKHQEIVRLDLDLLQYDRQVIRPDDLRRDYIRRGLQQLAVQS